MVIFQKVLGKTVFEIRLDKNPLSNVPQSLWLHLVLVCATLNSKSHSNKGPRARACPPFITSKA
jgi:hypothetical protein